MTEWMDSPKVSGLYWAYREGRTKDGSPSICKVNVLSAERWAVTFLSGNQTYTFRQGQGWVWRPAEAPTPPRKVAA